MSSTLLAQTAYAATAPVRTSRDTEYAAFQKVTAQMLRVFRAGGPMADRAAALHRNRQLWTTLATDLASDDNDLPEALRAQLLSLADFSILNGRAALSDPEAMRPLIDINTAVMRGLSGESGAP